MELLFIYLFLALFVSFTCSIAEAVLLSIPISYLKVKAEEDKKSAKILIKLKQNINKPLAAILSLNTIAHTVGAAGVGAQATILFGDAYFGIVSAILTILILFFTEIIPKTLGANYNKELMGLSSSIILFMIFITYPLVLLSTKFTKILSKKGVESSTSREEIAVLANIAKNEGIFGVKENRIIQNIMILKNIKIFQVMTPRVVVVAAEEEMQFTDFLKHKDLLHFSRIPIYQNDKDNITGYILREIVFENLAEDKFDLTLNDVKRDIIVIPEGISIFTAWELMLAKKEHIALVIDEYGGMAGIVTFEDIIETIFGFEILDEKDIIEDMQKYALDRWKNSKKKHLIRND